MVQNNQERAYQGVDGEIGALVWRTPQWCESEIRVFAGAYYFDTDSIHARSLALGMCGAQGANLLRNCRRN